MPTNEETMHEVHPSFRHVSMPGVPRADRQVVQELATRPKKGRPLNPLAGTLRTLTQVTDDLGFSHRQRAEWETFLRPLLDNPYATSVQIRADVHWRMQEVLMGPEQRRAFMRRILNYWRAKHAVKSIDAAVQDVLRLHPDGAAPWDLKHLAPIYGSGALLKSLQTQCGSGAIEHLGDRFYVAHRPLYIGGDAVRYQTNLDTLTKAHDFVGAMDLVKAAHHKYIRRVPTGKQRPKYRYIYSASSKSHNETVGIGEKVRIPHGDKEGHYEVTAVRGKWATIKHDESGRELTVLSKYLHEMFLEEHGASHDEARAKLEEINRKARRYGTTKQKAEAQAKLDDHVDRFPGKSAFDAKDRAEKVTAAIDKTTLDYREHHKAAKAHRDAIKAGSLDAPKHAKAIRKHVGMARLLRKKAVREGRAKPKEHRPGRMGDKSEAWKEIEASMREVTQHTTEQHRDTKMGYSEFDSINEALNLKKPDKFARRKDLRVKDMATAFRKLTSGIREWYDPALDDVIELLRTVPGYDQLQLPQHAIDYRVSQEYAAQAREHAAAAKAEAAAEKMRTRLERKVQKKGERGLQAMYLREDKARAAAEAAGAFD